jgi:hypothetical protein
MAKLYFWLITFINLGFWSLTFKIVVLTSNFYKLVILVHDQVNAHAESESHVTWTISHSMSAYVANHDGVTCESLTTWQDIIMWHVTHLPHVC